MPPAWACILLVFPILILGSLLHFYLVSRVIDSWHNREVKPLQDRVELLEGQLREFSV